MFRKMPQPEEVFTPRSSDINRDMYVDRPSLESAIISACLGSKHILIHGESGTGKSWLYKKVFQQEDIYSVTSNMALASRFNDLNHSFKILTDREGRSTRISYSQKKAFGITTDLLAHENHYTVPIKEPFERALFYLRKTAGKSQAVLVLDNFEQVIQNKHIIKQLADIIILLDDSTYAKYEVKIAIVGVPADIQKYFATVSNANTIANRLHEIPEVARLSHNQAKTLIHRGLEEKLRLCFDKESKQFVVDHILWFTDRIPQPMQELCLEIARVAIETDRKISPQNLRTATGRWVQSSLSSSYAAVVSRMNAPRNKVGRRDQTLYALSRLDKEDFTASDVETRIREQFPVSTKKVGLNISQILNHLASGTNPIIKSSTGHGVYCFAHPRYRMCVRAVLQKTDTETIERLDIQSYMPAKT